MRERKVSVIIPVYNAEKYLTECMESILSQTYKHMEIICVDDGSTDGSAEIIRRFQKKDARIKLIRQANQYAGVARNNGFRVAEGEYVIFLDADDYFDHRLIEKMAIAIHEKNADIVICGSRGFDETLGKKHDLDGALNMDNLPEKDVFSKRDIPESIFQLTAGWAWDKMYRADFIREKNLRFQDIRAAEDELFVDVSLGEAEAITVVKEVLITHRTNVVSSLAYKKDQFWYCGYEMLSAEKAELERRGLFRTLEKSFVNRAAGYIAWYAGSMTTPVFFSEFYSFYQKKAIKELGLSDCPEELYDDPLIYETIKKMEHYDEKEFLCDQIRVLNQAMVEKDICIQECTREFLHVTEWLKERMGWMQSGKRWVLPDGFAPKGSRIILYGFGDVGRDWYREIQKNRHVELVMVVDRDCRKFQTNAVNVCPVEAIGTAEYDYVLIAINEKDVANAVKEHLVRQNVPPKKIIWLDPAKRISE